MFITTFKIHSKFKDSIIDRLRSINEETNKHGMIFNYSIKPFDSFEFRNYIIVTINSNYQLVATYNTRRHIYNNVNGTLLDPIPFDIKHCNVNRCYLCNSVRDRNEMKIIRFDKDRCVAIGSNCYKSIDYYNLVICKYKKYFVDDVDFDSENRTTSSFSYFNADDIYRFIVENPSIEYIGVKKARELRVSSTSDLFREFVMSAAATSKVEVPNDWLDKLSEFGNTLPNNDFNQSLNLIINDIRMHNNCIHLQAVSLFLFFIFKYRDQNDNDLLPNIVDFDNDKVDDDVILIDFKKTNLVSNYDNKFINKITFKNDNNQLFVWYSTKVVDKSIGKRFHIKTKTFSIMTLGNHKVCKVKNLRGIK